MELYSANQLQQPAAKSEAIKLEPIVEAGAEGANSDKAEDSDDGFDDFEDAPKTQA